MNSLGIIIIFLMALYETFFGIFWGHHSWKKRFSPLMTALSAACLAAVSSTLFVCFIEFISLTEDLANTAVAKSSQNNRGIGGAIERMIIEGLMFTLFLSWFAWVPALAMSLVIRRSDSQKSLTA